MENYQLTQALNGLEKVGLNDLAEMLRKETFAIPRSMPGAEILQRTQNIINKDATFSGQTDDKAFLTSTQNLSYLSRAIPEECQSAFVILGGGDNVFELLARGIRDITAADINPTQSLIYALKEASILSLGRSDYESFSLKSNGKGFLNPGVFKKVQSRFIDERYQNVWTWLLKVNPLSDIKRHLLKRVENAEGSYDRYRLGLYHLTKDGYLTLKNNMPLSSDGIIIGDAFAFLAEHPEKKYDYIDLTNIVSVFSAIDDQTVLNERLAFLQSIWENNLNEGGTMTFDYQFGANGINYDDIIDKNANAGLDKIVRYMVIYKKVYEYLRDNFDVEDIALPRIIKCGVGKKDTVLYARKRAR